MTKRSIFQVIFCIILSAHCTITALTPPPPLNSCTSCKFKHILRHQQNLQSALCKLKNFSTLVLRLVAFQNCILQNNLEALNQLTSQLNQVVIECPPYPHVPSEGMIQQLNNEIQSLHTTMFNQSTLFQECTEDLQLNVDALEEKILQNQISAQNMDQALNMLLNQINNSYEDLIKTLQDLCSEKINVSGEK